MTVNSEDTPRVQYTANSITTIFPITFVYDDISDVHVYFISNSTGLATAWTKDASGPTGYTVSAGAIVANTAPSNGYLVAVCTTPVTQLVDVKPNRALTADTLEGVFDKLTLIGRDLKGSVSRALIYGPTYTGSIPYAEDLADEIKQDSVDASVAAVNALTFATSLHIDNLAALRLFPGGETTSIYLDCYTSNGDGGHGTFYWDATSTDADDGQDTIAVTGVSVGRWKRNIDSITGELSTHINRTTVHGSTDAPTPGRIVQRDVNGCSSFAPGTDPSHAVVVSQLAAAVLSQIVSSFEGGLSGTNSGWLKLPGGLIIQWGKNITASTENTWIVHDFPIPFPTTAFVIVGTGTDASVNLDPDIRINIYGLGQFRIWNTGYTSKYVNWIALGYEAPQGAITDLYTWLFDDNNDTPFILCSQDPEGYYKLSLQAGYTGDPTTTASAYDPTIRGISLRGVEGARRHAWFSATTYCPVPGTVGWRVELDFKLNYTMLEYYTDEYDNTYEAFASILAISFNGAAYPWTFDINYSPLQRKFMEGFSGVLSDDTYRLVTTTAYKLMLSRYDSNGIELELFAEGVSVLTQMFLITDIGTGAMRFDIGSSYDDRYFPATITNFRVYEHGEVV